MHEFARAAQAALLLALFLGLRGAWAQAAEHFVGTITATSGETLTVKTDAGVERQVQVPSSAVLKRIEPGQRDLSAAVTITLSDLATGDRVLVRTSADSTGTVPQAAQIIAIKRADVAEQQQQEREAWRTHGVGGLVKSVDPATGTIELTTGAGPTMKTITVHVTKATVLKRYAPASVRFDLAQPAPLEAIQAGDQLRARGENSPNGAEMTADEIVSGSFRSISGLIMSLDAGHSSLTVKDLMTKKNVTVEVPADAQMRALPEMMARALAARLKGEATAGGTGQWNHQASGQTVQQAGQSNWKAGGNGAWRGAAHAGGGSEMQQMLSRAPAITFAALKKGEAVMLVSTAGENDVTAITLLTGVEPLLQAPEASSSLLSNWSMGSGGADEADTQ
ncbi:MAG: hypothetical protein WBD67_10485 [Terracidiphilus sp.]